MATVFRGHKDGESGAGPGVRESRSLRLALAESEARFRCLRAEAGRRIEALEAANRELLERNRKLCETQLRLVEVERLAGAGALAASLAHAINNPLAALIGSAGMLFEDSGRSHPQLERILRLARRIDDAVQVMLRSPGDPRSRYRSVSPSGLVAQVEQDLKQRCDAAGVRLATSVRSDLPSIVADPELLLAALLGVAANALEAMHGGGELSVRAERPSTAVLSFEIADSGPGIPAALRVRIFEPFYTTKDRRTGLGLAIARAVVEGHRGRILVGERPGGGARFRIQLPLSGEPE